MPCLDRENTCPMSPRASLVWRTCPSRRLSNAVGTTDGNHVQSAGTVRIGIAGRSGRCTTWGTWSRAALTTSILHTPSIIAPNATSTSTPTCRTWPCPTATTRTAWLVWRSGWWSKMACPTKPPVGISGEITGCLSLGPQFRTGLRPGGKRAESVIETGYLDWALADFSGYIAADELYDGPYCVLSIVDNRTFKRITYRVLDHDPTHDDIREFFTAFRNALHVRGLVLRGITTDGSPLYPGPIAMIFPGVRHQVCEFHVIAEITKAVLHAVSKVRKQLGAQKTPLGRGRPRTKEAKRAARLNDRLQRKIGDLFDHRHLFVAHHLTPAERRTVQRITRGLPHLRTLREIMDEVYRLFDRRCRTHTALAKLAKLRMRVRRFRKVGKTLSKLFSPNLEKALTFLDDSLLPATSNAVERGNRRHRKMQKTVYRVRTQQHIHARIAIDMLRDAQANRRFDTTHTLHHARAG
jgi:hypothetical protein